MECGVEVIPGTLLHSATETSISMFWWSGGRELIAGSRALLALQSSLSHFSRISSSESWGGFWKKEETKVGVRHHICYQHEH